MINTEIYSPAIYYSPYGYVEIDQNEFIDTEKHLVQFIKKPNNIKGRISKKNVKDQIMIHIKTFYGDRRCFSFEVGINEKLSDLIAKICIEEDKFAEIEKEKGRTIKKWNYAYQYRLISSNWKIRELNPNKTFKEESINNNETLILLNQKNLHFSEANKGTLVFLESKNKVAFKQGGDEHQFAFAEQGFNCGKAYCEVILETEPYERSVLVGVSLKRTDFNLNSSEMKGFYGFVLSECKKVCSNATTGKVELVEYGDVTKMGDRIGIMMEFDSNGLDVSYYINKINMGVAFKGLPLNTYYPTVVLGFDGTRIRITNKVGFPDV